MIVSGSDVVKEICPNGIKEAVCYKVVDIGLQKNDFGNKKPKQQLVILFEINETMEDGRRFMLSNFYSATLGSEEYSSKLRKLLVSWRGKSLSEEDEESFETQELEGKNCSINIIHEENKKGKQFAKIDSIMPAGKDQNLTPENTDIPNWLKKMRSKALNADKMGWTYEEKKEESDWE